MPLNSVYGLPPNNLESQSPRVAHAYLRGGGQVQVVLFASCVTDVAKTGCINSSCPLVILILRFAVTVARAEEVMPPVSRRYHYAEVAQYY